MRTLDIPHTQLHKYEKCEPRAGPEAVMRVLGKCSLLLAQVLALSAAAITAIHPYLHQCVSVAATRSA